MSKEYDFVIIGSGFGGLCCAYILASEGYKVVVLEKNNQLGGNLQVFSRDKCVFDTGVHYVGGLDEGSNLYQFFKYLNLIDTVKYKRLDDAYDVIRFADGKTYRHGQGYDKFKQFLYEDFPDEKGAIDTFCDKVQEVCKKFPLYNLEAEMSEDYFGDSFRELNAHQYISSITKNVRLQNVLAGSNLLYAGIKEITPFYVHALILNSYIMGAYRFVDGGSQVAKNISRSIRNMGGEIYMRSEVVSANYTDDGKVSEVVLGDGKTIKGKKFISNLHPAITIDVFGESRFLSAYKKRVKTLPNSISSFIVHITFKPHTFPYLNYNIYQYGIDDVWEGIKCKEEMWPETFFVSTQASSKNEEFAESLSVMCYMDYEKTASWQDSFNTVSQAASRGEDYEAFKKEKEEQVLQKLEEVFPDVRNKIENVYSSTPLTFRDYLGNGDGSMYGIVKDCNNPTRSFINPKTKIPNLYLTGQNLIFHGILGVTIGAFVTCFEFIDRKTLVEKIKQS